MAKLDIRAARPGDEDLILMLLTELADYEKLMHAFHITRDIIASDFMGANAKAVCEIAESEGEAAGIMIWTRSYATFAARTTLYLEDLFVRPAFRGRGFGKALLAHLAGRAVAEGAVRLDWAVLDWNKPSIEFYDSLGAEPVKGWLNYRIAGDALAKLAQG